MTAILCRRLVTTRYGFNLGLATQKLRKKRIAAQTELKNLYPTRLLQNYCRFLAGMELKQELPPLRVALHAHFNSAGRTRLALG